MFGQLRETLMEVAEDATTSIGNDLAELSEGETPEVQALPEVPEETEEVEGEVEEVIEEVEETEEVPENLETTHPFDRPSIKQLEEAYPGLMKKFPALRDMYFR